MTIGPARSSKINFRFLRFKTEKFYILASGLKIALSKVPCWQKTECTVCNIEIQKKLAANLNFHNFLMISFKKDSYKVKSSFEIGVSPLLYIVSFDVKTFVYLVHTLDTCMYKSKASDNR